MVHFFVLDLVLAAGQLTINWVSCLWVADGFCCTLGGGLLGVVASVDRAVSLGIAVPTLGAGMTAAAGEMVSGLLFFDCSVCLLAALSALLCCNAWFSVDCTLGVCIASV